MLLEVYNTINGKTRKSKESKLKMIKYMYFLNNFLESNIDKVNIIQNLIIIQVFEKIIY